MRNRWFWFGLIVISIILIVLITALLVPQDTHPAYDVAVAFVNAASSGEEDVATSYLHDSLQTYVAANCPDGQVSACVSNYAPAAWGDFANAVFRRAIPDGADAWDIQLLATYAEDQGFSGVCVYTRVERNEDRWEVVRWAGFVSCDAPNAGLSQLINDPNAPNQAP